MIASVSMPEPEIVVVAMNHTLFGLDRATGAIVWQSEIERGQRGAVALAIVGQLVIASPLGYGIHAFDLRTGFSAWTADTTSAGRATLLVDRDRVVCAKAGHIDCVALADGKLLWSQPLTDHGQGWASLGVPGNVVQADESR